MNTDILCLEFIPMKNYVLFIENMVHVEPTGFEQLQCGVCGTDWC
jgi:hypothetical protein